MNSLKSLLPHLFAIVAFFLFVFLYFSPQFKGEVLYQSDIVNFKGMSKEIVDYREATGEEPLWTGAMFCGMPAYQISVLFSNNLIKHGNKIFSLGIPRPAGYVFLYFIGFYFLGLMLGWGWQLSLVSAFGFGLSSYFFIILEAGHNSKAVAIAYMAPLLGSILMTLRDKKYLGAILTALFMALELAANHFQITYYTFMLVFIIGCVYLYNAIKNKSYKDYFVRVGLISAAVLLGVAVNMGRLWTTYEYTPYTTRGKSELKMDEFASNKTNGLNKDYATSWSYGVSETFTLLIPNFMGGGSRGELSEKGAVAKVIGTSPQAKDFLSSAPTYWGQQPFTSGPVYAGSIMCFLFVLGLFFLSKSLRIWLGLGVLFSIVLAWGKNFMVVTDFFLDYVPFYNKFRAVSMILVVAELCIPLGAFMVLHKIIKKKPTWNELKRPFQYSFGITGGLCLIFGLLGGSFFDFQGSSDVQFATAGWYDALLEDRASLLKKDAWRSFMFILGAAGIIYLFIKDRLKVAVLVPLMGILILADMVPINLRYLDKDNFVDKVKMDQPFQPTVADNQILRDTSYFRVFNTTERLDRGARTSYFHKSLGGYHGAKMRRYQELIDHHLTGQYPNREVLNMLNAKYFIVEGNVARRNPDACGAAWAIQKVRWADDADDVLKEMENFRSYRTVVIETKDAQRIGNYVPDTLRKVKVNLRKYDPKHLIYDYKSDNQSLVVFSEIYYPEGWTAYIDGVETDYWSANYVLRCMNVPAGEHVIEFVFKPTSYKAGSMISLISSIVLILLVIGGIVFRNRLE